MSTETIERRFAEMGARVSVRDGGPNPSLNVLRDKKGEFFTITADPEAGLHVVNIDAKDRHLLLVVGDGNDKSKFLCGHDERHWFVAAIPESVPNVTTVVKAKEALQPVSLQNSIKKIRKKSRLRRRNAAYARQGEWFFTPIPEFDPPSNLIHRNEPITRGRGKPHIVEFLVRDPGATVYVFGGRTISQEQFSMLSPSERKANPWSARTSVAAAYAKGKVSHPDHATINLSCWHRIEMNTEQRARAMSHVSFID